MKFMIMRMADAETEAGVMPTAEQFQAMGEYNQALAAAGLLVDGMGLMPSAKGARIQFHDGIPTVTDGPFTESKEILAGFTLIRANSKQEALDWVKRWPVEDGHGNANLQLRQVYEMADFETNEGLEIHQQLCERRARQPNGLCVYLSFAGNCAQAFAFYRDLLGGEIQQMFYHRDAPPEARACVPEASGDQVMHACIQIGPYQIMGADVAAEQQRPISGFCLQLQIDDTARAEQVYAALAEDGVVVMALAETFWAHRFGIVHDRFGTPWMINSGYKSV